MAAKKEDTSLKARLEAQLQEAQDKVDSMRDEYEAAKAEVAKYSQMLDILEGRTPTSAAAPAPRSRATKGRVTAKDAIIQYLRKNGDSKLADIVNWVEGEYGHQPNSIRATANTMKKEGEVVTPEKGIYSLAK